MLYGPSVIPRAPLNLIYLPIIAPRRLQKVEILTSLHNLFEQAQNVKVLLGPLFPIFMVGAVSCLLR